MFPSNTHYPEFVPDQLLTTDDLNSLFGLLDEQGRMTRTNLVGVGIVCGLELRVPAAGTQVTVTKGTGVTTQGYLVALDDAAFGHYRPYVPPANVAYEPFVAADGSPRLDLWELVRASAVEGSQPLDLAFLNGGGTDEYKKVALVFVELRRESDKTCNPQSCDDKGQTVTVTQRVLLARKGDLVGLGLSQNLVADSRRADVAALPRLARPRFNVPATKLTTTAGIFSAYKNALPDTLIAQLREALNMLWGIAQGTFGSGYESNPFASVGNAFAIVQGPLTADDLLTLQYVYDHLGDLVLAYEELRDIAARSTSLCCPAVGLFGRHLLLGSVLEQSHVRPRPLRHGFAASSARGQASEYDLLQSLFRRLVLMVQTFRVPPVMSAGPAYDPLIRITPSRTGQTRLSERAMPWYYPAATPAPRPFYTWWNFDKTAVGRADEVHGYHARDYTSRDDVRQPFYYDGEAHEFFRVEGHVGKPVALVLATLKAQVSGQRLPVEVLALATGTDASGTNIAQRIPLIALHAQFETQKAELLCCLREYAAYLATLDIRDAFTKPGDPAAIEATGFAIQHPEYRVVADAVEAAVRTGPQRNPGPTPPPNAPATTVSSAEVHVAAAPAAESSGTDRLERTLSGRQVGEVGLRWLEYQQLGIIDLGRLPAPTAERFDERLLEHWTVVLLDQIQGLIVALEAEDLQSLDVDLIEARRDGIVQALDELMQAIDTHLAAGMPLAILKAYLAGRTETIDSLSALMPGMSVSDAHALVRIVMNAVTGQMSRLKNQLSEARTDLARQRDIIRAHLADLDGDALAIAAAKEVVVESDPYFAMLAERLRSFRCLCTVEGFRHLHRMLAEWIDSMRRLNLFGEFSQRHPGIQHGAGVPPGGTFIVVYHSPRRASSGGTGGTLPGDGAPVALADEGPIDSVIRAAADEVRDGTVIADFYLPYVCCSDQPPITFQVLENAPPPAEVLLNLERGPLGTLAFSVGDGGSYAFETVPAGGALSNATSDWGVVSPIAGTWEFRPSGTVGRLGAGDQLEVEFSYSRDSVVSQSVRAIVHNLPAATIAVLEPRSSYRLAERVTIASTVTRADALSWLVAIPGGTTVNVANRPVLVDFELAAAGVYSFTLVATQSATGRPAVSNVIQLVVRDDLDRPDVGLARREGVSTHDYSVGDAEGYAFALSPVGGQLRGGSVEAGVSPDDGGLIFTPAAVSALLGAREVIDLEFVYELAGRSSQALVVSVWAVPRVTIETKPTETEVPFGTNVSWVSKIVGRADSLTWHILPPGQKEALVVGEAQLKRTLNAPGVWTIRLRVVQTSTGRVVDSNVVRITVGREGQGDPVIDARDCGDLDKLLSAFSGLKQVDAGGFATFERQVLQELGVGALFGELGTLANESLSQQLETFAVGTGSKGSWIVRIRDAMDGIMPVLGNTKSKVSKPLLVRVYQLLGQLMLYINCVLPDDIGSEQQTALTRLGGHFDGGKVTFRLMKLDIREEEVIAQWGADLQRTLEKEAKIEGEGRKDGYVRSLTKVVDKLGTKTKQIR